MHFRPNPNERDDSSTGSAPGETPESAARGAGSSPLLKRLESHAVLSPAARAALEGLTARPSRRIASRRELVRHGASPDAIHLIQEGWACRYKTLPDGRRQIIGFLIPGDLCDLDLFILERMDHGIEAITALDIIDIPPADLKAAADAHPEIIRALWWQELVTKSCHREWIVNVGARSAVARVAHLLCEMFFRLESIGAAGADSCVFPLTQRDLADATGLTPVHVNRTLQKLRERGLIALAHRVLTIPDLPALMAAGQFNPDYLHLKRLDRRVGAKGRPAA